MNITAKQFEKEFKKVEVPDGLKKAIAEEEADSG